MPNYTYLYDQHSETGNAITDACNLLKIRHENSQFRGRWDRWVLNWGSSKLPEQVRRCRVLNKERSVYLAVNKLRCLNVLSHNFVNVPEFYTRREDVMPIINEGGVVYGRHRLTGHDGQGLVRYTEDTDRIDEAPLYTLEVPNIQDEYRVSVFDGEVYAVQRKVRAADHEGPLDPHIRTTEGGWGFVLEDIRDTPMRVLAEAVRATEALELDFAGVDVVCTREEGVVLEVNTAPQMTPVVLRRFVALLNEVLPLDN